MSVCSYRSELSSLVSTGKRRYGHPALTGVLPQPWLPLKKGQSMTNGAGAEEIEDSGDTKPVVLTLRKRYSIARSSQRTGNDHLDADGNPWDDAGSSSRPTSQPLNHRLSFDHSTGVIMLPDSGDWLEGGDSDSEEDYGVQTPPVASNRSQDTDLQQAWGGDTANAVSQSPNKRYSTYYHHPERRKRT